MSPSDLLDRLHGNGHTLAFAESLTGGLLADAFITVPGASRVVRGGIIAYATDTKAHVLGVDADLLERNGPVDGQVAEQMASGARGLLQASHGLSATGVAGPDPQGAKPVGTVYVGIATPTLSGHRLVHLEGDRGQIRIQAITAALALLAESVAQGT